MALQRIPYTKHRRLLEKLKTLNDEDVEVLSTVLGDWYLNYQVVIQKLEQVIVAYQEIAAVVRKRMLSEGY